jgi:hypothetical protein
MIDQYNKIRKLGEKDAVMTLMKHSWFWSVLPFELSHIKKTIDNNCTLRYLRKNIPWIKMPIKDAMILDPEETNSLYDKTKRWNTQKMINILYILNSDMPEDIKVILFNNPSNIDDIPHI